MPKIEIDLADLGLSFDEDGEPMRGDLRDQVISQAAQLIADRYRKSADEAIKQRMDALIGQELTGVVREVLSSPIQRRTPWGEPVGSPTTVLEIAREKLAEFFAKPDRRDSYSREQGANLRELVNDVVKDAMTTELKPAIAEARVSVAQAVRERLSTAVVNDLAKTR